MAHDRKRQAALTQTRQSMINLGNIMSRTLKLNVEFILRRLLYFLVCTKPVGRIVFRIHYQDSPATATE